MFQRKTIQVQKGECKNILPAEKSIVKLHFSFKTLFEFIKTSAAVDKFLFAGKERMTLRTNFNLHIAFCGSCFDFFTASASDGYFFVIGMYSLFHLKLPLSSDKFLDL